MPESQVLVETENEELEMDRAGERQDRERWYDEISTMVTNTVRTEMLKLRDELKDDIGNMETQLAVIEGHVNGTKVEVKELQKELKSGHRIEIDLARLDERLKSVETEGNRVKNNENHIRGLWVSQALQFVVLLASGIVLYFVTKH